MIASLRIYGAALAVASLASGCGTQPSPPGAEQRPTQPPPPPDVRPPPPPPPPVSTTATLVDAAFAGATPAFPLLSSAGDEVAMGIASPIGSGTIATYRVVTFRNWTNLADAWGSSAVDHPIVDVAMTSMLLDRAMGEPAPLPDRRTLVARAAPILDHLRAGGFTPFDGTTTTLSATDTAIGPIKLRTESGPEAALTVRLLDANDRELATNTLTARPMGIVGGVACFSAPAARRAWLDTRRQRVLVEIGWNTNGDGCPTPDPEYGMWPTP